MEVVALGIERHCFKYIVSTRVQKIVKLRALIVYRKLPSICFTEMNMESI